MVLAFFDAIEVPKAVSCAAVTSTGYLALGSGPLGYASSFFRVVSKSNLASRRWLMSILSTS